MHTKRESFFSLISPKISIYIEQKKIHFKNIFFLLLPSIDLKMMLLRRILVAFLFHHQRKPGETKQILKMKYEIPKQKQMNDGFLGKNSFL